MTSQKSRYPAAHQRAGSGNKDYRKRARQGAKPSGHPANTPRSAPQPHTGNATAQPGIILKPGREKSLLRRHPWVFSGAVERVDGAPASGGTLPVRSADGEFLAWAAYSSGSQITARVWSWDEDEKIDAAFLRRKIAAALAARDALKLAEAGSGLRLIHAESDGLPGLVVDQYGGVLVMQIGSAGAEHWRDAIAGILQELCKPVCIYERSDSD